MPLQYMLFLIPDMFNSFRVMKITSKGIKQLVRHSLYLKKN